MNFLQITEAARAIVVRQDIANGNIAGAKSHIQFIADKSLLKEFGLLLLSHNDDVFALSCFEKADDQIGMCLIGQRKAELAFQEEKTDEVWTKLYEAFEIFMKAGEHGQQVLDHYLYRVPSAHAGEWIQCAYEAAERERWHVLEQALRHSLREDVASTSSDPTYDIIASSFCEYAERFNDKKLFLEVWYFVMKHSAFPDQNTAWTYTEDMKFLQKLDVSKLETIATAHLLEASNSDGSFDVEDGPYRSAMMIHSIIGRIQKAECSFRYKERIRHCLIFSLALLCWAFFDILLIIIDDQFPSS